jgi:thiol-disulfide isomerase/thioredoxin
LHGLQTSVKVLASFLWFPKDKKIVTLEIATLRRERTNRNRFRCLLLLSAFCLPTGVGCNSPEPTEVSAETSGYLPKDSKTASSPTSKAAAPASTGSAIGDASVTEKSLGSAAEGAPAIPPAAAVPTFEPGKVDPKIAAKEYMQLKLPEKRDAESLLQFLERSSRSVRELIADGRRKLITNDMILERGMALSRMKMEAAELLGKLAQTDDEKLAVAMGKMEALAQMTGFGDIPSSDDLRAFAAQEMSNTDPRISQQAKSISLGLLTNDFESGTAKSEDLSGLIEKILSKPSDLIPSNLLAITQALERLDSKSESELALQLAKKTEVAFRDFPETQVALGAWEQHAGRLEEMKVLGALMDPKSTSDRQAATVKNAIDSLMTKIPSPLTAFVLVQIAIQMEYSGSTDIAKDMIALAETQIENAKGEAKEELARNCSQFNKRLAILNKPMDFTGLVDVEGKPMDLERYKGKVVLVDFWASWCGPCIQEIPNIEKVYEEKNAEGFEVIGVNLDEERVKLDAFLEKKPLKWATYVSSSDEPKYRGFKTPLAAEIGIAAIPFVVVIGKDGNVAAIHVRGPKLETTIAEQLAK